MTELDPRPPIFVVGCPRSGTTLLAAMLCAHSRLSCGSETHFFSYLDKVRTDFLCDEEAWPERAVDFLYTIMYMNRSVPDNFKLDRASLRLRLLAAPRTVSSILSSVTESHMQRLGKARWVEKTPGHLKHVDSIRKHFPSSPVIKIIRDPRDTALSLSKVSWGPRSFEEALLQWLEYEESSRRFFQTDRQSVVIRYEDLLLKTEAVLRSICSYVNERYEPRMLDTAKTASEVNSTNEEWKRKVALRIDSSRAFAWKYELTQAQRRLALRLTAAYAGRYGY